MAYDHESTADRDVVISRICTFPRGPGFDALIDPMNCGTRWGPNEFTTTTMWNGSEDEHATFAGAPGSMTQGWGGTLDRLTDYLAALPATTDGCRS